MESNRILQAIEWIKIGSQPLGHGQFYLLAPIDFDSFFWGFWDDKDKKFYDAWFEEIYNMHWCCENIAPEYKRGYFIEKAEGVMKRTPISVPIANENSAVKIYSKKNKMDRLNH